MRKVTATKLKESCLSLLDEVGPEGLIITKRGRPVAKLVPYRTAQADLIGSMKGQFKVKGDLLSSGIEWDAQS